jgi:signal transduction histidine kinase
MNTLNPRLLFVEEDREFLQQLRQVLPQTLHIETVSSVEEALKKLQLCDVGLVGVDLNASNGAEAKLLDWVRENRPATISLLITTSPAAEAALRAEKLSAFDYLLKPIDPAQLSYCMKRALSYHKLLVAERESRFSLERLNKQVGDRIRRATGELINSNERLSAANRAKDQFLAAMSHELRTPLTAITGAVRILQSRKIAEAKAHSILEVLDRNVGTLKRLLDDLLDCSRIASGKLTLELVPTNLVESIAAAVETMRHKAAEANVRLEVSLPSDPVPVDGNALRLQQIAWNLIDNAIKFTPGGGTVRVALVCVSDNAELVVSDSGLGIPDEERERIFEPFAQAHGSEALRKGGLGLGLALVRNITQLHNGDVRVESDGLGQGARFIVTLPLCGKASPFQQAA